MSVVLVVDDDPDIRRFSSSILRSEGFTIVEASSGAEAMARFDSDRPDAVLLDVNMPHMSGFDVCRTMRSRPGGDMVPVAFFTAHGDFYDEALDLAANDFLSKPIRAEELVNRVRALVRAKRFAEALREGADDKVERSLGLMRELRETLFEPVAAISAAAQILAKEPLSEPARAALEDLDRRTADLARLVKILEKRVG